MGYDAAREILWRAFPSAVFRHQPRTDWGGDFVLPDPVIEYYAELGPVDVDIAGYGNPYFLPSLARLWPHQVGYRMSDVHAYRRLEDWDDDWLVIADEGGDPFIYSRLHGTIYHAYHGEGVWEPYELFDNLPEMVTTLAILGETATSAGRSFTDGNSCIVGQYRDEAYRRISEVTGSEPKAYAILLRLGWI